MRSLICPWSGTYVAHSLCVIVFNSLIRAQSNGFYPRTAITISRYFACREMVGEWCLPDKLKALVLFNERN